MATRADADCRSAAKREGDGQDGGERGGEGGGEGAGGGRSSVESLQEGEVRPATPNAHFGDLLVLLLE